MKLEFLEDLDFADKKEGAPLVVFQKFKPATYPH
jgi:hypothetical protein